MPSAMSSVLTEVSRDFPQSLQGNAGIVTPIISSYSPVNRSSLILQFEDMNSTDSAIKYYTNTGTQTKI